MTQRDREIARRDADVLDRLADNAWLSCINCVDKSLGPPLARHDALRRAAQAARERAGS